MATEQVDKRCSTCLHSELSSTSEPCGHCFDLQCWEPTIGVDKRCSNCYHCDDSCTSLFNTSCGPEKTHFMARTVPSDRVDPKHYSRFKIQPMTFISENNLNYLQGNVIKYVCRFPYKGGVMDLKKAARYLEELIACAEVDNGKSAA